MKQTPRTLQTILCLLLLTLTATVAAKADTITFVGGTYQNVPRPGQPNILNETYTENGMSVRNNGRPTFSGGANDIARTEIFSGLLSINDNHANVYDFTYNGGLFDVVSVDGLRSTPASGFFFFVGTHADGSIVSSSYTFRGDLSYFGSYRPADLQVITEGSSVVLGTGFQNLVNFRWEYLSPQPGVIPSGWGNYTMDGLTYRPATRRLSRRRSCCLAQA